MASSTDPESPSTGGGWRIVCGIGWLVVVAGLMFLTRHLDPRSWLSSIDLPAMPWYVRLLGPVKIVVVLAIAGAAAAQAWRHEHRPTNSAKSDADAAPGADTDTHTEPERGGGGDPAHGDPRAPDPEAPRDGDPR